MYLTNNSIGTTDHFLTYKQFLSYGRIPALKTLPLYVLKTLSFLNLFDVLTLTLITLLAINQTDKSLRNILLNC